MNAVLTSLYTEILNNHFYLLLSIQSFFYFLVYITYNLNTLRLMKP